MNMSSGGNERIYFRRFGIGPGSLKEEEIELTPLATALKEYRSSQ